MSTGIQPAYLDTRGAAEYINCSKSYLDQLRVRGDGPRYTKLGRKVLYKPDDLDAWMAANSCQSTSEYTAQEGGSGGRAAQ